jgi:Carotenoid biosynthesis protein
MDSLEGDHSTKPSPQTYFWLGCLIAIYAASRILQVFPFHVPILAIIALHVLPPIVFAWIHGAMRYGVREILAFFAICIVVANVVENVGVLTGFPFGHYYFTGVMGPKILHIPIFLGLLLRNGLFVLDHCRGDTPKHGTASWRITSVRAAAGLGIRHGCVGSGIGSRLGYHRARLGVAGWRRLLRGAAEQLFRLVSERLHLVSAVCPLLTKAPGRRHSTQPPIGAYPFCSTAFRRRVICCC